MTKRYPGVLALDDVSLSFARGEIHALMGENGAGKSTLVKLIAGAETADEGTVAIEGRVFRAMNPALAKEAGISVIWQESNLVPSLSVAENLFLGLKVGKSRFCPDFGEMDRLASEILGELNFDMPPGTPVFELSAAQRQLVEIARATAGDCKVLIMDEPSAALALEEARNMFRIVRELKAKGVTIIYISHRIDEVFGLCDRASVLRDGRVVATEDVGSLTRKDLIRYMVGRELNESYPARDRMPGDAPGRTPGDVPGRMPGDVPDRMSGAMPGDMPSRMPGDAPGRTPGDVPDRTPGRVLGDMLGEPVLEAKALSRPSLDLPAIPMGEPVLEARDLSGNGDFHIDLVLRRGEILGLAGLTGSGRSALAKMLCGDVKPVSGEIEAKGRVRYFGSVAEAVGIGIGLIPEDRKAEGLFMDYSIAWNISAMSFKRLSRFGIVDRRKADALADEYIRALDIKAPSAGQTVCNLSGGNQQKAIVARVLAARADILIFDEPTKGVDVGAKQEIYRLMNSLTENGNSIIMISSDMEELLGMSDRIVALYKGRKTGELQREEFSREKALELALGYTMGYTAVYTT